MDLTLYALAVPLYSIPEFCLEPPLSFASASPFCLSQFFLLASASLPRLVVDRTVSGEYRDTSPPLLDLCSMLISLPSPLLLLAFSQSAVSGLPPYSAPPQTYQQARSTSVAMLYLIGLGLSDEKDVTVRGLEAIKGSDRVYLEAYTSILGVGKERLVSFEHLLDACMRLESYAPTRKNNMGAPARAVG